MTWRLDDKYTVALLHLNGSNGGTSFPDETGTTWTPIFTTTTTSQYKFGGSSATFTTATLSAADSAKWRLDDGSNSNKWTIDFWLRFSADPGTAVQGFLQQRQDDNNFWTVRIQNNLLDILIRSGGSNIVSITNAWNPAGTTWYHIAYVKNGTSGYMMFVDGTQVGTTQTNTNVMPDYSGSLVIGDQFFSAVHSYFSGHMQEMRISKGIARWTSNFTPPTRPYMPYSPVQSY